MRWTDVPIHFIDFEGSLGSGVLEFGVVTLRKGEIAETRTRFCGAAGRIRAEDSAVHHITSREVDGCAPFANEFDLFASLRESGPLAAHFAGTENALLKSVWPYARTSPDFARPNGQTAEWGPWIDSGRLCSELLPGAESMQLDRLVRSLELQAALDALAVAHCPPQRRFFHAALYDALAGALLLQRLLKSRELEATTLPWLLQASTSDKLKKSYLQQDTLF